MVEQPCATEAPPAASKVYDGELDEHQLMQKSLHEALAGYTLALFNDTVPDSVQEHLKDYHELINAPAVGCPDNHFWPSWQLNIAPAQACQRGRTMLCVYSSLLT